MTLPGHGTQRAGRRVRPRLSRTVARPRWREYRRLLSEALACGYAVVSLESWLTGEGRDGRTLVLRHDVDQDPRAVLTMAAIESDLGLTSTWYFRWRTAHPTVIRFLRAHGFEVGLHYETLTRMSLERAHPQDQEVSVPAAREVLRREIEAFAALYGPLRSVAPHGDSRVPEVRNAKLLQGESWADYGIAWDSNEAMRGRGLGCWLTDRSSAEGGWKDGVDADALLRDGVSPILCLTHPNNWSSGASLWRDRALRALLPPWTAASPARPIRSGSDSPSGLR